MIADIKTASPGHLYALLVGQFQVSLDSLVLDLGYNKVRALLAYLVVENDRAHSRDELAALLWPESSDPAAHKSLRQALTRLRAAVRDDETQTPLLLVTRETIRLNPLARFSSDVGELHAMLQQCAAHVHADIEICSACIARLERVAALYKGDLLKNFSIPDSLPFEEWLLFTREGLRLQAIDVLGHLMASFERSANDEAAMQYSRRRLVVDPYNEDAYRSLMRVMARCGQRTAALAEYERCKRVLAEELGIEPSSETMALSERIRAESGPGGTGQEETVQLLQHRLPVSLTDLLGREKETAALLNLLRRDSVRLVTLMGSPGIGKTRLSMHLAGLLKDEFDGNVYFISLAGITNPALCVPAMIQTLGLSSGVGSPLEPLIQVLKDRPALMILDTFEQVLEAAPVLSELLQACPKLKLLVTARAPLHLRGEQRFLLTPLALPAPDCQPAVQLTESSPAVRLFVERVQAVLPEFSLSSKNAATIGDICARLDGLPLAIELAAPTIRWMSPQRLLDRLTSGPGSTRQILKERVRDGDAHHQTLWQAFQWSYDLLTPDARMLFARLGVFVSGWTLEAAEAVCNVGDIQPGMDSMAALLDNCLLQQAEGSDGEYRFSMLVTLREFALDRLAAGGEVDILHRRHADYFLTFAKLAETELTGRNPVIWLERIENDLNNLRAALDWTLQVSPEQALELAAALFPFWHVRSYLEEGRSYLEQALKQNLAPTPLRARVLAAAGLLAQRMGDFVHAESQVGASLQLCRELDDQRGVAYALNNLAIVRMSVGENAQAQQLADESLALCNELKYPLGVARAQMIIGQIALNEDHLDDAQHFLETSLSYWRQKGDLKNLILCLINLGRVRIVRGSYAEAFEQIEESLKLSRKVKDRHWEMVALWNLAEIHLRQGNPEAGAPLLAGCLEQAERIRDRYFEAITLNRLGVIEVFRGHYPEGDRLLNRSLELGRQMGSKWIVADALANLGYAFLRSEKKLEAAALFKESLVLFAEQGEGSSLVQVLEHLALLDVRQGRVDTASCLLAFASAWRLTNGEPLPPCFRLEQQEALNCVSEANHQSMWAVGQSMTLDQAVDFAKNCA